MGDAEVKIMKTVRYEVDYQENASRLEVFIRWLWSIPCMIVYYVLLVIMMIAAFLQFFHILLFAKRHKSLHDFVVLAIKYQTEYQSYFYLTDERKPFLPESK